jgi:hypothetical protein
VNVENIKDVRDVKQGTRDEVQHPTPIEFFDKQIIVTIQQLDNRSYTITKSYSHPENSEVFTLTLQYIAQIIGLF